MKSVLLTAALLLTISGGNVQLPSPDPVLPELHKIMTTTLLKSYGCGSQDPQEGYKNSALYLSKKSRGPDLRFDGSCGGRDYFMVTFAGDEMSLIADLGRTSLEELRTDYVFNVVRPDSSQRGALFLSMLPVEADHTYAVVINKANERGLLYFTVTGYVPNKSVDLRYAVKEYQLTAVQEQSPGFDWNMTSR